MSHREKIRAIVEILKKRFPNLTGVELVDLAFDIVEGLEPRPVADRLPDLP